ncbi:GIY-YIG nuclease family protein [Herbaspirillum huttiense]|uniref:GIY-YIG nuclease family protein n=1 Tax=Herbaspirillum huttiense TaxID=863372 RepID=UPI0039B10546
MDLHGIRTKLQAEIDSGQLATKQQLLDRVVQLGLVVTRNGREYLGLLAPDGKRFRVRFAFGSNVPPHDSRSTHVHGRPPAMPDALGIGFSTYWIYAIIAHSPRSVRKACYIGQTVNPKRRFREHLRRRDLGKASSALFDWAAGEGAEIRVAVLLRIDRASQQEASRQEGQWLKLAAASGYETPRSESWGRRPSLDEMPGQPTEWPILEITNASRPLSEVVAQDRLPPALYQQLPGFGIQPTDAITRLDTPWGGASVVGSSTFDKGLEI